MDSDFPFAHGTTMYSDPPGPRKRGSKRGSKIGHFGWSDHEGHDLTRSDLEIRRSDLEIARSKSTCRGLSRDLGYPKSDHFGPMESGGLETLSTCGQDCVSM